MNKKLLKNQFDENGYIVIKELIKKNKIIEIKSNLDSFIQSNIKQFKDRHINFTKNGQLNSLHFLDKWIWTKKMQNDKKIKKIAEILLAEKPVNFGAELFAKPAKVGLKSPVHQDNYYWCIDNANALTFWIALEKSNKNNGGVFYYNGSHKLGVLEHKPSFAPGSSQMIKYEEGLKCFKKTIPSLNPGDCIVHHSLVIHGSEKNISSNSRLGWTIRYISKSSKKDKFMEQRYLDDLKHQVKLRKSAKI